MLKKTITYEDFNGKKVTEDFYFHLSKADLAELEISHAGGLTVWIKTMIAKEDHAAVIKAFKDMLKAAYGRRSADGSKFIKKDEYWDEFVSTEAYSELFLELVQSPQSAAEFIKGMVPANLADKVDLSAAGLPQEPKKKALTEYTDAELREMPAEEFKKLFSEAKSGSIPKNMLQVAFQRSDV